MSGESKETIIELDSKKQITVKKFNKINLVDIREFYLDKDKNKKPGKKGISLTPETWRKLINSRHQVEQALRELHEPSVQDSSEEDEGPPLRKRKIEANDEEKDKLKDEIKKEVKKEVKEEAKFETKEKVIDE